MQLRDDDVLLGTFPKSGTHWMWRILDMLVHGSAEYGDGNLSYGCLDLQRVDRINNADSPRVLTTHMPFKFLPRQVKDRHTRVVHVYRNPKAVFVSMHLMLKNVGNSRDLSWDGRAERFLHGKDNGWQWTSHMDNVIEFERNNPQVPIHHVAYEDLKLCPLDTIQKLSGFLNVPATEELCQQIAKAVTFDRQKEEESRRMHKLGLGVNIYRRGEIDDWKNHLTVALSEQIDQALKERVQRCPFSARYLQPL